MNDDILMARVEAHNERPKLHVTEMVDDFGMNLYMAMAVHSWVGEVYITGGEVSLEDQRKLANLLGRTCKDLRTMGALTDG